MTKVAWIIITAMMTMLVSGGHFSFAQKLEERLTQEEFAVEVVKNLRLEGILPTAALARDCIDLLERIGIAPLGGWDSKSDLTQEDYLVVIAKAHGKETMLHQRAMAVEEKNIAVINQKWQEAYEKTGNWIPLQELLGDKNYFPEGPLSSPYKLEYEDRNGDHKVDSHFLPIVSLMKLRELLTKP